MTAKSLLNSLPARNMQRGIRENKKLMIVISILQVLGIPMCALALMIDLWLESASRESGIYSSLYYSYDSGTYLVIGLICFASAVIVGMAAAVNVFQEMWKKTKVDMLCSLPLTGTQRFFSHFLSGVSVYILPYVIAVLLGWLVILLGSLPVDFSAMEVTRGGFLTEVCRYYALGTLGMFLLMALYYVTSVLVIVCCGTQFESTYTILLLNCLIPGTMAAVIAVISNSITELNFEYLWQGIGYLSPVGGLIYLYYILSGESIFGYSYSYITGSEATTHGMIPAFLRWALVIAVIIAVCLIAAWQLYKRRKAEAVGQPFVYIGAYYFMLTLLTVLILCLMEAGIVGAAILFAGIVYFVMEVIRKRGFRRFWMSAVSFAATVALTIGMFALVVSTKGFGTVYRIPAAASVSSVQLYFEDFFGASVTFEYTDKEIIRAVQALHRDIIDDMKEYDDTTTSINQVITDADYRILEHGSGYDADAKAVDDTYDYYGMDDYFYYTIDPESLEGDIKAMYYNNYWYQNGELVFEEPYDYAHEFRLTLTYYTIAGSAVNRDYYINIDQYRTLLEIVYGTELYAQTYADYFYDTMYEYMCEYDEKTYKSYLPDVVEMELYNTYDGSQTLTFRGSEATLRRIADAYRNDLMNIEPDSTGGIYAHYASEISIWNNCTETIAVLEELGAHAFTVPEKFGLPDLEYDNYYTDSYSEPFQTVDIQIYAPDQYMTDSLDGKPLAGGRAVYVKPNGFSYEDRYYAASYISMREVYPELYALLDAAVHNEFVSGSYMIVVNGIWYAIPEEDSALAEAVISKGDGYAENFLAQDAFLSEYFYGYGTVTND